MIPLLIPASTKKYPDALANRKKVIEHLIFLREDSVGKGLSMLPKLLPDKNGNYKYSWKLSDNDLSTSSVKNSMGF